LREGEGEGEKKITILTPKDTHLTSKKGCIEGVVVVVLGRFLCCPCPQIYTCTHIQTPNKNAHYVYAVAAAASCLQNTIIDKFFESKQNKKKTKDAARAITVETARFSQFFF
jgi:hypothetical protein